MGNHHARSLLEDSGDGASLVNQAGDPAPKDLGRKDCVLQNAIWYDRTDSDKGRKDDLPLYVLSAPIVEMVFGETGEIEGNPLHHQSGGMRGVEMLRPHVEYLCRLIDTLQNPSGTHICSSLARHIYSTMHIESESVSEEDTLALVTGKMSADSDKAKLVTQMLALMQKEYQGMRPLKEIHLTVGRLKEWHVAMFSGIGTFADKQVGELRDCDVRAGQRLCPSKVIASGGLALLCEIVNDFAKSEAAKTTDRVEIMMHAFALASFTQYHFLDLHPFLDGNGRMGRFLCKYILESCLPLPFPMYASRDKYLAALRAGDARDRVHRGSGSRLAMVDLLKLTVESATVHYEELLDYVNMPILVGYSFDQIERALKLNRVECTEADITAVRDAFEGLGDLERSTVVLTGGSIQLTKAQVPRKPEPEPEPEGDIDIDAI